MPSWKVHREVGKIIIGFYDHRIDGLIDSAEAHDAGRYDIAVLARDLKYVWGRWGWEGVCYYVLHHVLDRIQDIVVSELSRLADSYLYGAKHTYFIDELYRDMMKNVLQRIRGDEYIWGLAGVDDEFWRRLLKLTIDYIVATLVSGWEIVMGMVVMDVSAGGRPTTAARLTTALTVKSVARSSKYGRRMLTSSEISDFLLKLGEIASREMEGYLLSYKNERRKWLEERLEEILPRLRKTIRLMESREPRFSRK